MIKGVLNIKQYITIKELKKLSIKEKKLLQEWWKPQLGDRVYSQPSNGTIKRAHYKVLGTVIEVYKYEEVGIRFKTFWRPIQKKRILPLLSIGQMIEFLDEHTNNNWDIEIGNTPMVIQCSNLCDALWEAVKEILEKNK